MAKVVLGEEFDHKLRERARDALRAAGCKRVRAEWGVGGSQELESEVWSVGDAKLVLEAETYMGLSISGPDDLVSRIATAIGLKATD